ncbi:4'-phosphopantetheinyl transferase [Leadbetterella byssophila DSM 17132]|uniref:4'-phosphopantetheinyl transferase n=1 Tax=Leadbetterella byssophila (strain DSM 17132 / JCM 16389 / KACC 11308 / NBRC 106382 / 4M15) TaxID=649349 RepID=E4RVT9_LEAB4|nr:4'-phosphopantetheinyl transferase superfamily protein [Leadbetterella byssophila]ADQ18849.1 4'-phosphopantetheinyl transferase [Leadbetterella byssophila DSM 17132]
MALFSKTSPVQGIQVVVWKLTESFEELFEDTSLCKEETQTCLSIPVPAKQKEFLAGKYVIERACLLLGIPYEGLEKDEYGKPYLRGKPCEISLTHTEDYVAVAFSENGAIGIDLEKSRDQIMRIFPRLFSQLEVETVNGDLEEATVYWSAKEAMYKLYGKRSVDFRAHLMLRKENGNLQGEIHIKDFHYPCQFHISRIAEYYMVLAY